MKKLVVILAAALLVTGTVAAQLWLQLREARAQNSTLQAQVSELQARPALAFRPAAPAAPAANGAPATPPADPAAPAARQSRATATRALGEGIRQMLSSPDVRDMARVRARQSMPMRYPDIGTELRLSPEETEKLYDLLAKQQVGQLDTVLNAAGAANGSQSGEELQRKARERREANEAELAAMLGNKYPQYQSYEQTLPTRRQVDQLQTMLGSGSNALSDAQARPLIAAIAAEQARINQERSNVAPTPGTSVQEAMQQRALRAAEDNRRLVQAASPHLNPQQLDSYQRMLEGPQNLTRIFRRAEQQVGAQGQAPSQ